MALITTPGADNADSFFTIEEADAYFSGRGVTAWIGTIDAKESAARRGSSYISTQYKWRGLAATPTQALAWPRVDGYRTRYRSFTYYMLDPEGFEIPDTVIPQAVKTAAMEAALLALTGVTLEPRLERGGAIKSIGKSVGPLRKDITYMDGAPIMDRYIAIEGLLRGFVTAMPGSSSGNVKLVRG